MNKRRRYKAKARRASRAAWRRAWACARIGCNGVVIVMTEETRKRLIERERASQLFKQFISGSMAEISGFDWYTDAE